MFKIIFILVISFGLILGCSSNRKVIRDNRYLITNASKWFPEYIYNDSCSGFKLEFTPPEPKLNEPPKDGGVVGKSMIVSTASMGKHDIDFVNITLWKYPLDTVLHIETHEDEILPWPENRADLTSIYYEIKNEPIKISSMVDSGKALFFKVPTGTYLMECRPDFDYVVRWMKNITVVPNCWSVVKVDTIPMPYILY